MVSSCCYVLILAIAAVTASSIGNNGISTLIAYNHMDGCEKYDLKSVINSSNLLPGVYLCDKDSIASFEIPFSKFLEYKIVNENNCKNGEIEENEFFTVSFEFLFKLTSDIVDYSFILLTITLSDLLGPFFQHGINISDEVQKVRNNYHQWLSYEFTFSSPFAVNLLDQTNHLNTNFKLTALEQQIFDAVLVLRNISIHHQVQPPKVHFKSIDRNCIAGVHFSIITQI